MIKAIIVENDPETGEALLAMLRMHCDDVEVAGTFRDSINVLKHLRNHPTDIVFLDIELDGETAFDLLEQIPSPAFEIVFTTAFSGYALRAIKHACLEYLLKPVSKDDLVMAIRKFRNKREAGNSIQQLQVLLQNLKKPPEETKLCIPVSDGFHLLNKSAIVMCQAEANYTVVHSASSERIICSKNLGFVEEMIDEKTLFRCHKSYLINLNYVERFLRKDSLTLQLAGGLTAEVSHRKKGELMERLGII